MQTEALDLLRAIGLIMAAQSTFTGDQITLTDDEELFIASVLGHTIA